MDTVTATHTLEVAGVGPVDVTYDERGQGRVFLLLHGGAGPMSMNGFAALLSGTHNARVLVPTHPGFLGTVRPEPLRDARGLAALYVALLDELKLSDVTVIGNSLGGWIAAEVAALKSDRVSSVVIVDGVGLEVEGLRVADTSTLTFYDIQSLSYFEPEKFRVDPTTLSDQQRSAMAANMATLAVYGGPSMGDSTLRSRLDDVRVPTLVAWGESDRIVDPDYGRAFADAIPGARFVLMARTGHLPQIETPQELFTLVSDFADSN
jgi:pimeloyl-ACP methyl ester carboxylesterase